MALKVSFGHRAAVGALARLVTPPRQLNVVARAHPTHRFSYTPVEVLKGQFDDPVIDLFVDSVSRRILARDPNRMAILVRSEHDGPWRSLGLSGPEFRSVVRKVLAMSQHWQEESGADRRAEFFAQLFGEVSPQILLSPVSHPIRRPSFLQHCCYC